MNKQILIVTNSYDLHADVLTPILIAKNKKPFRLNLDKFPKEYQFYQEISGGKWNGSIKHLPSNEEISLQSIGSVWLRKIGNFEYLSDDFAPQEKAYADKETEHALFSLLYSLDCYWISHPISIRSALWKGEQLQRAAKLGFSIPPSHLSNLPCKVKEFKRSFDGELIFKSMSSSFLAADEVTANERIATGLSTTIISDEMMESLVAVKEMPCLFQAYIPKEYELRVTIIGERIFAAKIHSQDDERTQIDFRDFSADILYEATELPSEIADRCLEFVHSYGLNYGAMDIIVTPEGDYVFLENNPVGQFWFVEQLVPELNMMETLADELIKGAEC